MEQDSVPPLYLMDGKHFAGRRNAVISGVNALSVLLG